MIVDELVNLKKYVALHPMLSLIDDFVAKNDLFYLPDGKLLIEDFDGFVNIQTLQPKTSRSAKWESHKKMIDLQIPINGDEIMGYCPLSQVEPGKYNEAADITFHKGKIENKILVKKGMFAIFFPNDVHAPGVTKIPLKKAVFKIPLNKE